MPAWKRPWRRGSRVAITPEMVTDPYIVYGFADQADELRGISFDHVLAVLGGMGRSARRSKSTPAWHLDPTGSKPSSRPICRPNTAPLRRSMPPGGRRIPPLPPMGGTAWAQGLSIRAGPDGHPGPTYIALDTEATPAMVADCNTFVQAAVYLLCHSGHNAPIRAVDPNHLISSPNDATLEEAVKGFDGKFDLLFCEQIRCYDWLTTKIPLGTMTFDFITAEMDSPLSFHGAVQPGHRTRAGGRGHPPQILGRGTTPLLGESRLGAAGGAARRTATGWPFLTRRGRLKTTASLTTAMNSTLSPMARMSWGAGCGSPRAGAAPAR